MYIKKKLFCIGFLALCIAGCTERKETFHCHIEGHVFNKPDCSVLLLLPESKNTRLYKCDTIPLNADGTFSYDLCTDENAVYSVIPDDDNNRGYYSSKTVLFAEEGHVNITFNGDEKAIVRSTALLNNELHRVMREADSIYLAPLKAKEKELEASGKDYTPEAIALGQKIEAEKDEEKRNALQEELDRMYEEDKVYTPEYQDIENRLGKAYDEMYFHYLDYAEKKPSLVGLYLLRYLGGIEGLEERVSHAFQTQYASRYPAHPITEYMLRKEASRQIKVGGKYYDFTAPDLNGVEHTLSKEIAGKVAIIDLWASWCGPCRALSKSLIPVYEAYKDKGFTIVGVAREYKTEHMKAVLEKEKYPWLSLLELNDRAEIWESYGIGNAAGTVYLVDRDGTILAIQPTAQEVETILKEKLK